MPNYSLLLSDKGATETSYKLSAQQLYPMLQGGKGGEGEDEGGGGGGREEEKGITESEDLREIALVNFELSH
ncbi:hypothetical protein V1478_017855 [Vespula squamosa]|uniref:Uncharacterized protein n=1 Tax=Vespula squamosa TaxID=30214 RepID=A0ABD1ZVW5_VESSQ